MKITIFDNGDDDFEVTEGLDQAPDGTDDADRMLPDLRPAAEGDDFLEWIESLGTPFARPDPETWVIRREVPRRGLTGPPYWEDRWEGLYVDEAHAVEDCTLPNRIYPLPPVRSA